MTRRRGLALAGAWILALGLARGVALPERCPPVTEAGARAAAVEAVGWMERNQRPDGQWVYRYDRGADAVDGRWHAVRHSGVALSLYQAHAAGVPGALEVADAGAERSLRSLVRHDDWAAVRQGPDVRTGATALLVAGLAVREAAVGDGRYDAELAELGRFLVAMTEPSGAVLEAWDPATRRPVPGERSPFFTGEAYYALASLATVDPGGGWEVTAARIGRYLATERDDAEDIFPPTSDHWAAYGLAGMAGAAGTEDPAALGEDELAYAHRQAGLFSVQVRYESQRTDEGLNRWVLRGPRVLGAGLGTLGEGLGSLWALAGEPGLAGRDEAGGLVDDRESIGERLRCVAGMLAARQVTAADAATTGHPGLARGAWFHAGMTQMDDQQHSLSALLLALPALAEHEAGDGAAATGGRSGGGGVSLPRTVWLALVAVAVVNPARLRILVGRAVPRGAGDAVSSRGLVAGAGLAAVVLVAVAALAGPVLDAADVSASTGLVAAGLVVVLAAAVDAVRPPAPLPATLPGAGGAGGAGGAVVPVAVPALVRPAVALLVVAVAGDAGLGTGVVVAAAAAAAALAGRGQGAGSGGRAAGRWAAGGWAAGGWRGATARVAWAAVAVVGGIDLVAHGVLGV